MNKKQLLVVTQENNNRSLPFLINSTTGERMECMESPERAEKILVGLSEIEGVKSCIQSVDETQFNKCLASVHDHEYLDFLTQKSENLPEGEAIIEHDFMPPGVANDTPLVNGIYLQALESAKTACCAAKKLCENQWYTYAICRPPGHHAGANYLGGYCYLNNAAIAVEAMLQGGFDKVGVLDIDYHFGNGTADLLLNNEHVIFSSIHADTKNEYPYYPIDEKNTRQIFLSFDVTPSEEDYLKYINTATKRIVDFGAKALVVSVGYDIIQGDPHGKWNISPQIYLAIGQKFASLGIPICFIQEGGYAIEQLALCAKNLAEGLIVAN